MDSGDLIVLGVLGVAAYLFIIKKPAEQTGQFVRQTLLSPVLDVPSYNGSIGKPSWINQGLQLGQMTFNNLWADLGLGYTA